MTRAGAVTQRDTPGAVQPGGVPHAVFQAMSATGARLERHAALGDGLALSIWWRDTPGGETHYSRPGHHTLSCYLQGGEQTHRRQLPGVFGGPQRLCALPEWHDSSWNVRGAVRFFHLYFLPEHFTQRAVIELDREPRELTLSDRTYFEHGRIAALCSMLAAMPWAGVDCQLRANEIAHETLSELLRTQATLRSSFSGRGGLSPTVRRRLRDHIESHLSEPLSVGSLASIACMTEYHFTRMFRVSFGMPPYAWIASRRMEKARHLLRHSRQPVQSIAAACGYTDLSHFSHRFTHTTGVSARRYQSVLTPDHERY